MRENIDSTRGVVFAERAMILLGKSLGLEAAHKLLEEVTRRSIAEGRKLSEVLGKMPEAARVLDTTTLANLDAAEEYLGVAEVLRSRLLSSRDQGNLKGEKDH